MNDWYIVKERGSDANGKFQIFYMLSFYRELLFSPECFERL
jgi:hypothetical protein